MVTFSLIGSGLPDPGRCQTDWRRAAPHGESVTPELDQDLADDIGFIVTHRCVADGILVLGRIPAGAQLAHRRRRPVAVADGITLSRGVAHDGNA